MQNLYIGMTAQYSQTVSDSDIKAFSGLSGDKNPVHMSDEYAQKTMFKKRIAHGFMSASYFSAIFGTKLPGEGCVYLSQTLKFIKPVYIGDTVTAIVTLTKINSRSRRLTFDTICVVKNETVISGVAE
ncbi:MaoC family dehydratase, partial [Shigella sonnei]|nr:MaoC family dehydratase [Escherichia coli]EHY5888858.1 MaoC family dehydratase [Shigella sonnei]EJM1565926.1 MaoC family dehydratase [Escherichia coli]